MHRCRVFLFAVPVAMTIAARVSVSVPIWFGFIRIALATFSAMPRARISVLVTNRSSPTSWTFWPRRRVSCDQPSQSDSAIPSSIVRIG